MLHTYMQASRPFGKLHRATIKRKGDLHGVRSFLFLLFFMTVSIFSQAQFNSPNLSPHRNFVGVWTATAPIAYDSLIPLITLAPVSNAKLSVQYFDGLGRPVQVIARQRSLVTATGQFGDMVTFTQYDALGRDTASFLPYVDTTNDGNYRTDAKTAQPAWYNSPDNPIAGQGESEYYAYSRKEYESSPLSRIVKTLAPGNSWVGSGRGMSNSYQVNTITDSVRIWRIGFATMPGSGFMTPASPGNYAPGALYKNITTDEQGRQVVEFKDKAGMVVLKKVQLTALADDGSGRGYRGWLCTYYIYDDLSNLRCVVQPAGVSTLSTAGWTLTTDLLNEQCFRYEYDTRNLIIMKKVPGAGAIYMAYDLGKRLVLSQDAVMRTANKWIATSYDDLGRPDTTYWYNSGSMSFSDLVATADTIDRYPAVNPPASDLLSVTHYDDYSELPAGLDSSYDNSYNTYMLAAASGPFVPIPDPSIHNDPAFPYPETPLQNSVISTRGMITWTEVRLLDSVILLPAVNIYDDKSRLIQIKYRNITGGIDIRTTQYAWAGWPLITVDKQEKAGNNAQTTVAVTKMTYDDLGRVVKTEKKISNTSVNGGAMSDYATVSTVEYDALGQSGTRTIGNKKDAATGNYLTPRDPLQTLHYDYNIRGWLLGMNRDYLATQGQTSDGLKFGFELGYDKTTNQAGQDFGAAQFTGNITGMAWKSDGDDIRRIYDFGYDAANRLLKADFKQQNDNDNLWNNQQINFSVKMGNGSDPDSAYDTNGNILRIQQWGLKGFASEKIDDLHYTYNAYSNKLKNVIDGKNDETTRLGDFRSSEAYMTALGAPKTSSTTDYSYDYNGNMKTDLNKDIKSDTADGIEYNHLNLPTRIRVKDKGMIEYTYDASGNKLKRTVKETGKPDRITLYLEGTVYENDTLQYISHEEGRLRVKGDSLFVYDYFIRDHLGNVRIVLTEEQKQDAYYAGFETADTALESQLFMQIPETQFPKPIGFDNDNDNQKVSKVMGTASSDKRVGPGIVLKVMAGDKFRASVQGWYQPDVTNPNTASELGSIVDQLINAFAGGIPAGGNHGDGSGATPGSPQLSGPLTDFVADNNSATGPLVPKAYLNWMILDEEQFRLIEGNAGATPIPAITDTSMKKQLMLSNGGEDIEVKKNGYLYVYVSNASKGNVYFDDLSIVHIRSSLLEETHYYPFGLAMHGISSKAESFGEPKNKVKYNGIEQNTDLDLNIGEAFFRTHDPQIGRWLQVDPKADKFSNLNPYMAMGNNPISIVDPRGDEIPIKVYDENGKLVEKNDVTPAQVKRLISMYQTEYGIDVSYDKENGTLVYAGEAKTDLKVSEDARNVMMNQLKKGTISQNKIEIGTGMGINSKGEVSFGNESANGDMVMAGPAVTIDRTSYFDMGLINEDLSLNSKSFTLSVVEGSVSDAKRSSNFARIFEHDFVIHNVYQIADDGDRPSTSPGPVESLVNGYRNQMGLGSFQALNYQSPGAARTAIKYYGDSSTGKLNAVLQVNLNFPR